MGNLDRGQCNVHLYMLYYCYSLALWYTQDGNWEAVQYGLVNKNMQPVCQSLCIDYEDHMGLANMGRHYHILFLNLFQAPEIK